MGKITKDAKMTWSDKISWIGGNMGLFTGFSVISGVELLYWIIFKVFFHKKDTQSSDDGSADKKELGWRERRSQNEDTEDTEVSSDKEDVESGAKVAEASTSCCQACKALAANVKIEAMETEIAEMKKALKARSSEGPAGMVFDAVFNTPDVGSAAAAVVAGPPPQPVEEPPKQEPNLPKVDVDPSVAVVEESSPDAVADPVKEEPAPSTPVPPVTVV